MTVLATILWFLHFLIQTSQPPIVAAVGIFLQTRKQRYWEFKQLAQGYTHWKWASCLISLDPRFQSGGWKLMVTLSNYSVASNSCSQVLSEPSCQLRAMTLTAAGALFVTMHRGPAASQVHREGIRTERWRKGMSMEQEHCLGSQIFLLLKPDVALSVLADWIHFLLSLNKLESSVSEFHLKEPKERGMPRKHYAFQGLCFAFHFKAAWRRFSIAQSPRQESTLAPLNFEREVKLLFNMVWLLFVTNGDLTSTKGNFFFF